MAILAGVTIDFGNTDIIDILQSDLTFISGTLYELNTDDFRLTLKSLEDDLEGITYPKTHIHNTPVTVGGVTLARTIEVISPYSVRFENLVYSVRLIGSNNNIFDIQSGILIQNDVQVIGSNSAGLIQIISGSGLSAAEATELQELHEEAGLSDGNPMTVTPSTRGAGAWTQTISGDGDTTTTVTRD